MWLFWATHRNCSEYVTILSHIQELYMWLSWAITRNCTEHVTILSHKSICKGDYPESHTRTVLKVWLPSATYRNCTEYVTTLSHIQELYWIGQIANSSTKSSILGRLVTWLINSNLSGQNSQYGDPTMRKPFKIQRWLSSEVGNKKIKQNDVKN
jgi:hypothetical protein